MADIRPPFTPSIADLRRRHGDEPLTAAALVNELFRTHEEYAPHVRRPIHIPENPRFIDTVDGWLMRAGAHFRPSALDVLHGRLVIIGLALAVPEIQKDLDDRRLLQGVASEIKEGVARLLTPEAERRWRLIETGWRGSPSRSAPPPQQTAAGLAGAGDPTVSAGSGLMEMSSPARDEDGAPPPQADTAFGATPARARTESPGAGSLDVSQAQTDVPTQEPGPDGPDTIYDRVTRLIPPDPVPLPDAVQTSVGAVRSKKSEIDSPAPSKGREPAPSEVPADPETVPAHPDDPAVLDTLARRPFARCIAGRMDEVWRGRDSRPTRRGAADTGSGGAFMLHLHGPWGSGKSSILNFLRDELQDHARPPRDRWVVVEFNAWRHQRIRPPWWALIRDVYAQSARQLPVLRGVWLRVRWWAWRVRADWLPVAAAAALILVAVLLISGVLGPWLARWGGSESQRAAAGDAWKGVDLALKLLTGVLAAWGAVFAAGRSLAFGSARAAQAYTDLKSDPLGPIVRLFQRLTAKIGQPVAVFIDDLDRCDGKYVVELLEGIQTLFRTAPVTYVVAADRKWICASFQQGYKDFGDDIGEAGRPLGYLFLDKLFQVSASVPRPAPMVQRAYWGALLSAAGTADAGAMEARQRRAEQQAQREVRGLKTTEELQAFVQAAADPVEEEGRRAVAAQRITTPEAQRETQKHLLEGFAELLEPNPRSMKRLVNAYGLHQATHFLEHRYVPPGALARWTIIELRWPLLADYLSSHPESLAALGTGADGVPAALKPLFQDAEVSAVLRGGGGAPLDEPTLRQIAGSVDARQAGAPGVLNAGEELVVQQAEPAAEDADPGERGAGPGGLAVQTQG